MIKKPSITPKSAAPGAISRYDDFVATHVNQTQTIHFVGQFLPWHRWYTAAYEKALREECQYRGAQPYWDWTLDTPANRFTSSPVFDPVYGFGGNGALIPFNSSNNEVPGRTGGGCILDGPFKNLIVQMGPLDSMESNPRCLTRDLSPYYAGRFSGRNLTRLTLKQPDFGHFDRVLEGGISLEESGIHGGGHFSVGGTYGAMGDPYVSPSDPIFWLHHANLDRVWWSWQMRDLAKRLKDMSGPVIFLDWGNEQGGNTTLDYVLSLGFNAKDITVGNTMDIKGGKLCYDYDEIY